MSEYRTLRPVVEQFSVSRDKEISYEMPVVFGLLVVNLCTRWWRRGHSSSDLCLPPLDHDPDDDSPSRGDKSRRGRGVSYRRVGVDSVLPSLLLTVVV